MIFSMKTFQVLQKKVFKQDTPEMWLFLKKMKIFKAGTSFSEEILKGAFLQSENLWKWNLLTDMKTLKAINHC